MIVLCPTCGAEVEFRYDDSFVRICASCKSAVVRSDRGVESLGKVADLVPTDSPLRLFASGRFGSSTFLLVGMAQIRHAAGGLWQEWYAKLDTGWAWLSEAQGRFYLSFEKPGTRVPPFSSVAPAMGVVLGDREYTVNEVGTATYVSALGEIPYRLEPTATFRFADLADASGGFATIDYGDPADPDEQPAVYLGQQVTLAELALQGGEVAATSRPAQGKQLACPNCGGSLELRAPDQTLRVGCPYCNHMLSVTNGTLAVLAKLGPKANPRLPLGSAFTFIEGALTIIGYLQRSALVDGVWYPFHEYLLYTPALGFRWLVQSDGHWNYVQPLVPGAVTEVLGSVSYDGVRFDHYQTGQLRVDEVVGEFYWQVEVGEQVHADDYVSPPAMLSREASPTEINWSLSRYLTRAELEIALGRDTSMVDPPVGIAPNQPYPLHGIGWIAAASFALLLGTAFVHGQRTKNELVFHDVLEIPNAPVLDPTTPATEAPSNVVFTKPFQLTAGRNITVEVSTSLHNNWAYVALDLVNETTGSLVSFDANLEHYSGVEGGESWSEGSERDRQYLAPMEAGSYVVRVEGQHGGVGSLGLRLEVRQDVFRARHLVWALTALSLPFLGVLFHSLRFKKRRWENSNISGTGGDE